MATQARTQNRLHLRDEHDPSPISSPPLPTQTIVPPPQPTSVTSSEQDTKPDPSPFLGPRTEFLLDWTLKVLGVASAILFVIWAPMSYKATADGNNENNASQDQLMGRLDSLSDLGVKVSNLASMRISIASGVASLNDKLDGMGVLRVWEFCATQATAVPACSTLTQNMAVAPFLTSLASLAFNSSTPQTFSSGPLTSATQSPTATPQNPSEAASGKDSRSVKVGLAVGLGVLFGGILVVGLVVGILTSRKRVRGKQNQEEKI